MSLSKVGTGWGQGFLLPHSSHGVQCLPPQGPARAAAGGQAARSLGCGVLGPRLLPAGAAQWPPGVAQGAGRPPCGGLYSHGPGTVMEADKDPLSAARAS
jgi:hypothetical protein